MVKTGNKLRDHMTDLELNFIRLGEASATEIARQKGLRGFIKNRRVAKEAAASPAMRARNWRSRAAERW